MKNHILFFVLELCIFSKVILAQNSYQIKEYYDKLYPTPNYSPENIDYTNSYKVGNSLSWILSSLLRMYQETTGDKAYLIKFINHCILIQNNRWDMRESGGEPVWVEKDESGNGDAYFNSLLIYPMAEFVNMIINEPKHTLYNTNLSVRLINNLPSSNTILGYGDFANWLGKRLKRQLFL